MWNKGSAHGKVLDTESFHNRSVGKSGYEEQLLRNRDLERVEEQTFERNRWSIQEGSLKPTTGVEEEVCTEQCSRRRNVLATTSEELNFE